MCVDGYSRIIMYAYCCNNSKADTVLKQFVGGINSYGLPSRVRSDYGMENIKVAEFMLEQRGCNKGSIITGSSVHNCRVERTHRDIYSGVLCFFTRTFAHLEDNGFLDPFNQLHLHYTFMPRINKCLQEFKRQWENHPYLLKRIVLLFSYIWLGCLKMNTLDTLQLQVCLIQAACMIMDLIPQVYSPWKKTVGYYKV